MSTREIKLNEATLQSLPVPENGEVTYPTTYPRGLTVRVRAGGSKTFYLRIWNPVMRKNLKRKLGDYPAMSVAKAVKAAKKMQRDWEDARWDDKPVTHLTFGQAYKHYRESKTRTFSIAFQQTIEQSWRCIPNVIRNTLLDDVKPFDLAELVASVAVGRNGTAFHLRRVIRAVYKLSVLNEWCTKDRTLTIEPIKLKPRRTLVSSEDIRLVCCKVKCYRADQQRFQNSCHTAIGARNLLKSATI